MNENKEQSLNDASVSDESLELKTDAVTSEASPADGTADTVSSGTGGEAPSTAESEASADTQKEQGEKPKSKKQKLFIALGIAFLAGLLAVCGAAVGFVLYTTRPVTAEVGERPDPEALYQSTFLRSLYELKSYPEDLDTPGDYSAKLRFFGFLDKAIVIRIRDSLPPVPVLRQVHVLEGIMPSPEDFLISLEDCSQVTLAFVGEVPVHEPGEHEILLAASDIFGNTVQQTARIKVWDRSHLPVVDLNREAPQGVMRGKFPEITEVELESEGTEPSEEYLLRAAAPNEVYLWRYSVTDTVPPEVETKNLCIRLGETVEAAAFVSVITDVAPCKVVFADEIPFDEIGIHRVDLNVVDAFGNSTASCAEIMIGDLPAVYRAEYGADPAEMERELFRNMPLLKPYFHAAADFSDEAGLLGIGSRTLRYETEFGYYEIELTVEDTVPPELEVEDITAFVGDSLSAADFVVQCTDYAEVIFTADTDLSTAAEGTFSVTVTATDSSGNKAEGTAVLTVISDTEAPVIHGLQNLFLYTGQEISSPEGVYAVDNRDGEVDVSVDLSGVNFHEAGSYKLLCTSTDAAGNTTAETVIVEIISDTEAPVIYGAKNLRILAGETVSFRKGVYATDPQVGAVTVTVDSSAVNTNAEGVYPVYYSCSDPAGNTASVTVYLTVTALSADKVNELADQILSWIITPQMTVYEKAWAVYAWCTGNLQYSTRTSYLMGEFVEGAYSGLTTRRGNCYIYYAVASVLLTRAGIENIEIRRDNPDNPHYWNLVKINGSWFHFDTCPHYSGHWIQSFLLTDAQVRAYSEYQVPGYYSFDASLYPATP